MRGATGALTPSLSRRERGEAPVAARGVSQRGGASRRGSGVLELVSPKGETQA